MLYLDYSLDIRYASITVLGFWLKVCWGGDYGGKE